MNPTLLSPDTRVVSGKQPDSPSNNDGPNESAFRVAHVLRKCDPAEWGGTETALQRMLEGLGQNFVSSVVFCPRLDANPEAPLPLPQCVVRRFRAFVPVAGISRQERRRLTAVGGNLMSLDLPGALLREPGVSLVHAHALGRLGGIAAAVAGWRRVPLVVTIHGGLLDIPPAMKREMDNPTGAGWEWGKIFGLLLRSRQLLEQADAIVTCNPREAELLRARHPDRRIEVQPHGVSRQLYETDHREAARSALPQIRGKPVLLCLGRIDPIKNQGWLVEQAPELLGRHPDALLVFAGACTDEAYGQALQHQLGKLGLTDRILFTGGFAAKDPRLIGLLQEARALILPSLSETFGIVLLEAWAAGTAVIASRTSGASALIRHGQNGWLFDLNDAEGFHRAVNQALIEPGAAARCAAEGGRMVARDYDNAALARRMKGLYQTLIEEKHATGHPPRR